MHSYFETLGKFLLITKYLTSKNMPNAQLKKGHLVPHCPDKGVLYNIIKLLQLCNKLTATFKKFDCTTIE